MYLSVPSIFQTNKKSLTRIIIIRLCKIPMIKLFIKYFLKFKKNVFIMAGSSFFDQSLITPYMAVVDAKIVINGSEQMIHKIFSKQKFPMNSMILYNLLSGLNNWAPPISKKIIWEVPIMGTPLHIKCLMF